MGKLVNTKQSHAILQALASNVDWDVLDGDNLQQQVINNPKEAGAHFTIFLKNGARLAKSWREQDGVIHFSVTSDGTTGENWITRLESKGFRADNYAKQVLRLPDFKPTNGVTTEVTVLKGMLFDDQSRITEKIRAEAGKRKLLKPNAEVACLIREKFTDQEIEAMGLWWIVTMHEPIKDSDGDPSLLQASRSDGGRWLNTYNDEPDDTWDCANGFAFTVSQVSPLG